MLMMSLSSITILKLHCHSIVKSSDYLCHQNHYYHWHSHYFATVLGAAETESVLVSQPFSSSSFFLLVCKSFANSESTNPENLPGHFEEFPQASFGCGLKLCYPISWTDTSRKTHVTIEKQTFEDVCISYLKW